MNSRLEDLRDVLLAFGIVFLWAGSFTALLVGAWALAGWPLAVAVFLIGEIGTAYAWVRLS